MPWSSFYVLALKDLHPRLSLENSLRASLPQGAALPSYPESCKCQGIHIWPGLLWVNDLLVGCFESPALCIVSGQIYSLHPGWNLDSPRNTYLICHLHMYLFLSLILGTWFRSHWWLFRQAVWRKGKIHGMRQIPEGLEYQIRDLFFFCRSNGCLFSWMVDTQ